MPALDLNALLASIEVDDKAVNKASHYANVSKATKGVKVQTPETRLKIKMARASQVFTAESLEKQRTSYERTVQPRREAILAKIGTDYVYGSPKGRNGGKISPTLTIQKHGLSPSKWLMDHLSAVRDSVTSV